MKNPETKTNLTYSKAIKETYNSAKKSGDLLSNLNDLTAGNIRKTCLNLIDQKLSLRDEMVMKNFFEIGINDNLRSRVKKHDLDKFKPIIKFLKGDNRQLNSHDALELIALLLDFTPRPYNSYLKKDNDTYEYKEKKKIINSLTNNQTTNPRETTEINTIDNKSVIKIFAENKKIIILFSLMIALIFAISSINQQRWMEWQEDHYIEVDFDAQKLSSGVLKLYKEERINNFKQKIPNCDTEFFKSDGSENLWYGKNSNGKLEYFTSLGLHPKTGKTLKRITRYMIKKYVCETYTD